MLLKCCATHVLPVIWDAEFDGDTHFKFDARKGQLQLKLGQIRSDFKIQNVRTKICLPCADFPQDFKKCHLFLCTTVRNAKNAFQKCDVITFTCFFGHCTAKNKDNALKFCILVACMYHDHIYSVF